MKKKKRYEYGRLTAVICLISAACCIACACASMLPDDHIDLADTFEGEGIVTAKQFIDFLENGEGQTASLLSNIDLERDMLKIPATRGPITIEGNGFSVVGSGDCVIRLDDGAALTLNGVRVEAGADAIGCLGAATIGGEGLDIVAEGNGIVAKDMLTVSAGSIISIKAIAGSGLAAKGITLDEGALVDATAGLNAVHTLKNDITLNAKAELLAYTATNYNAVKCADTLVMEAGSRFVAHNSGDYHGAEIDSLSVNGLVRIECKGGGKGMGMFVFTQNEDICVLGSCTPEAQFENGAGSITFVDEPEQYNEWVEQQAQAEVEDNAANQNDTEDEG